MKHGNSLAKMEEIPFKLKGNKMKYSDVKKIQTKQDFISFLQALKKII